MGNEAHRFLILIAVAIVFSINGFLVGCAHQQESGILLDEITVTHRILIPGTDQYCEVDEKTFTISSCEPTTVYGENEE